MVIHFSKTGLTVAPKSPALPPDSGKEISVHACAAACCTFASSKKVATVIKDKKDLLLAS